MLFKSLQDASCVQASCAEMTSYTELPKEYLAFEIACLGHHFSQY